MNKLIACAAVLILAACGFHLKGQSPYSRLPYQNWYIGGGEMQQALEDALIRAKGRPSAARSAQASVVLEQITPRRDVLTVTRAALINEYMLALDVRIQAYRGGEAWGKPFTVSVRRNMAYADSRVLGKQEEEAQIWQEMQRDAAEQIVRRLAFLDAR
ncbi:MAG: LPS assembly lipoprotein LptE [Neisseria sp.]|nr:LPS assembly lipoprotein LptE [Neisseria sp.]